jgi:UPF0176 protein
VLSGGVNNQIARAVADSGAGFSPAPEPQAGGPGPLEVTPLQPEPAPPDSAQPEPLQVAAFYGFTALNQLAELRNQLQELAAAAGVRGTILLASEGVNGTISGSQAGVARVLNRLRGIEGLERLQAKFSQAPIQAFHRLKVRVKPEIVTMGCPEVKPAERVGTYVAPAQWDELIRDPHTLVVDTRNDYEVAIGSFAGAIDPKTSSFREFPAWVQRVLRPLVQQRQPRAIAMFCTGGIRCEKASSYLLQQGFTDVHHLQGGILNYLEQIPEAQSSWQGECYVFDKRVAVNHSLEPGVHSLCHACGLPLSPAERQLESYVKGVSCIHCIDRFSEADRVRFADRQRQMELAAARGAVHIGVPPRQSSAGP